MSQHKYNDAYNKGFEDGKKKAFDDWVYQCYDELSPKEQIELLLSKGAELPRKAVLQALEDVRAKVHANILMFRNEHYENKEVATGCDKLIESINDYIDRKIKEISGKDCRDCKKWNDCECGKKGHDKGTSIGYSVGECAEYEVTKNE